MVFKYVVELSRICCLTHLLTKNELFRPGIRKYTSNHCSVILKYNYFFGGFNFPSIFKVHCNLAYLVSFQLLVFLPIFAFLTVIY